MKHAPLLALPAAILSIMLTAPAGAQMNPQRNAATWYLRAYDQVERIPQAQWQLLTNYDTSSGHPPTPALREALHSAQSVFGLIERGSMQQVSNFPIDRSQGLNVTLPPLATARDIVIAMRTDAIVRLHDGDARTAAERIAAGYRMSGHLGHDELAISSLVGNAMLGVIDEAAQYAQDNAAFGANEAAIILRAIDQLPPDDPFNFLGSVVREQELVVQWLEGLGENMHEELGELLVGENAALPPQLLEYTHDQLQEDIQQYDRMMDQVVDAFAMEDHDAAMAVLKDVLDDAVAGEFGSLAMLITPAFTRIMEHRNQGIAKIKARRESLMKLIGGEADPVEFANAATWYRRGIAQLDELSDNRLHILRTFNAPDDSFDDALLDAILPALSAMLNFEQGAAIERCDFSIAVSGPKAIFLPRYLPGMRDAFRLLHADAMRLMDNEETDAAVRRLTTSARMIAHLSGDPQLLSAVVSHAAFRELTQTVNHAIAAEKINDEQRAQVLAAVERIDRTDPFGYLAARRRVVDEWPDRMRRLRNIAFRSVVDVETDEQREQRREILDGNIALIERADEPALLFIHAVDSAIRIAIAGDLASVIAALEHQSLDIEHVADGDADDELTTDRPQGDLAAAPRHALHDVLEIRRWLSLLQQAEAWQALLEDGDLPDLRELDIRPLSRLADRRASARRDLRETVMQLRPDSDVAAASERESSREATDAPFAAPQPPAADKDK